MHSDPNANQLAFDVDGAPTLNDSSTPSASAVTEPSTPPCSSANALDALLNEYRARAKSEREKGTLFEELTRQFLLHDARFAHQFKEVYLWGEWPQRRTGDTGIDLVAIPNQQDSGPVAIQCNFYASPLPRHLASEILGRWDEVIFGGNVTTEVLARICEVLDSDISEICEIVSLEAPSATTNDSKGEQ